MSTNEPERQEERLVGLLRWLAELAGKPFDEEQVRDALGDADGAHGPEALGRAMGRLGFSTSPIETSPEGLLASAPVGTMFLALGSGPALPVLLEPMGSRVRVHQPVDGHATAVRRWVGADGVARLLGVEDPTYVVTLHAIEDRAVFESKDVEVEHEASPLAVVSELVAYEREDVGVIVVYALAVGLFTLVTPLAAQALVSTVAFGTLLQPIVVLGTMVLLFLATSAVLRSLQAWVVEMLERRFFIRTAMSLADRLPRLDLRAGGEARRVAELVPRFLEVASAQKAGASLLLDGLESTLTIIVGLVVLAFYHPFLLAFDLLLLAALAVVILLLGRRGVRSGLEVSSAKYEIVEWLQTVARNPSSVRTDGGPAFAKSRADERLRTWVHAREDHFRVVHRQRIGALATQSLASTGLLVIGGHLVVAQDLTLGQLVAAELIVTAVAASLVKFAKHAENFYDLVAALTKLSHLDHLPVERASGDARHLGSGPAALSLDVRLADGGSCSLDVAPGRHLLVIEDDLGPCGAGLRAAFGIEAYEEGTIRLDGTAIDALDLSALRRRMVLVGEPEIWPASRLDNVRFGRAHVSVRNVQDALRHVGALQSALSATGGLARGILVPAELDARERVALAVARAIVDAPGLVVLDGTLDCLSREEAATLIAALTKDARWTLVVRTRMRLDVPAGMGSIEATTPTASSDAGGPR